MLPFALPSLSKDSERRLTFCGAPVVDLAKSFGTPLWLFDAKSFRDRIDSFVEAARRAHANTRVAYAAKANSALAVLAIAESCGIDVDVASEGELEAALRAGFPAHRIHVHGNNKSDGEIERAVRVGVRAVVMDSIQEVARVAEIVRAAGVRSPYPVLLRLAPGVDPVTHHAISTGQEDTKFGMNISDGSAEAALRTAVSRRELDVRGFHCHVGSQLMDSEAQVAGAERLAEFAVQMRSVLPETREIAVGGGLGIRYTANDDPEPLARYCQEIAQAALSPFRMNSLQEPELTHEPGRHLVGESGASVYTVGVRKEVPIGADAKRSYISIDGGVSDNPRPQLYDAVYTVINASRADEPHDAPMRVSGRHCETDTLVSEAMLPMNTGPGDIVLFLSTGAYTQSMASNYNRYPRPPLVVVGDGEPWVAAKRESLDDLFAQESVPSKASR
jgi:diaminopimelate decarboxylase